MTFAIFEDLVKNTSAVKIHLSRCYHFRNHNHTKTTKWHKVEDYSAAKILAKEIAKNCKKGWRDAKCCSRNRDLFGIGGNVNE